MLALILIHTKQRERVKHKGVLQSPHAESHRRQSMTILFILWTARQ